MKQRWPIGEEDLAPFFVVSLAMSIPVLLVGVFLLITGVMFPRAYSTPLIPVIGAVLAIFAAMFGWANLRTLIRINWKKRR